MKIVVENGKKVPKFYVHGNWISRTKMRIHRKRDFEAENKAKAEIRDLQYAKAKAKADFDAETKAKAEVKDL